MAHKKPKRFKLQPINLMKSCFCNFDFCNIFWSNKWTKVFLFFLLLFMRSWKIKFLLIIFLNIRICKLILTGCKTEGHKTHSSENQLFFFSFIFSYIKLCNTKIRFKSSQEVIFFNNNNNNKTQRRSWEEKQQQKKKTVSFKWNLKPYKIMTT